jgi:hypothetical protein
MSGSIGPVLLRLASIDNLTRDITIGLKTTSTGLYTAENSARCVGAEAVAIASGATTPAQIKEIVSYTNEIVTSIRSIIGVLQPNVARVEHIAAATASYRAKLMS